MIYKTTLTPHSVHTNTLVNLPRKYVSRLHFKKFCEASIKEDKLNKQRRYKMEYGTALRACWTREKKKQHDDQVLQYHQLNDDNRVEQGFHCDYPPLSSCITVSYVLVIRIALLTEAYLKDN